MPENMTDFLPKKIYSRLSIRDNLIGWKSKLTLSLSSISSVTGAALNSVNHSLSQTTTGLLAVPDYFQNIVIDKIAVGLEKLNMDLESDIVTLEEIKEAYNYLHGNGLVVKTPTLKHVHAMFKDCGSFQRPEAGTVIPEIPDSIDLYLKLENMQTTGSFKIRGCENQMRKVREQNKDNAKLVTFSGGNYGKAFAYCVQGINVPATCIMPDTVPRSRVSVVKGFGVDVIQVPTDDLTAEMDKFKQDGYQELQPFNDGHLIAGHGSAGLEILEEVPDPDIILVCCGGGGLVSGVAAAVHLSGVRNCRVYAVEPVGAPKMHDSFKQRRPLTLPGVKSVATGLCPPYAGPICYRHCRWFVDDVLLVSDEEILSAMRVLFHRGIKAEPSGCAAMAALLFDKVPNTEGKKVVVMITGGNVTSSELAALIKDDPS